MAAFSSLLYTTLLLLTQRTFCLLNLLLMMNNGIIIGCHAKRRQAMCYTASTLHSGTLGNDSPLSMSVVHHLPPKHPMIDSNGCCRGRGCYWYGSLSQKTKVRISNDQACAWAHYDNGFARHNMKGYKTFLSADYPRSGPNTGYEEKDAATMYFMEDSGDNLYVVSIYLSIYIYIR